MSHEDQRKIAELEAGIAALERQRHVLGDTATDAALAGLREQLEAIRTQPSESEQRRQITVLFADLADYTHISEQLDPEDIRDILEAYFDRWKRVLAMHGGTAEKFIGDAVMAVFGIPTSHEDDPIRAVRAALDMQQGLAELNEELKDKHPRIPLRMRVGIHTGPVVAKIDKTRKGKDLGIVGDTVNTANRIEAVAPLDGILISHETFCHLGSAFDVQRLDPIVLKGKKNPVRVYAVRGSATPSSDEVKPGVEGVYTRMIGREEELQRLQDLLAIVEENSECRLVTIVGEAGVGKSRLFYEFQSWFTARSAEIQFLRAHASREKQFVPYALLHDLFAVRCEIRDSDSSEEAARKLEITVSRVFANVGVSSEASDTESDCQVAASSFRHHPAMMYAHFIGELLGLDMGESPHLIPARKDPQQLRDRGLLYIGEFLKAESASAPTVLLLEDIHWADESSLDALSKIAGSLAHQRIMIVALARPTLFERYPAWETVRIDRVRGREQCHVRLDLEVLSKDASARLVNEILQRLRALPSELRDLIVDNAEGNPLFIEELIKKLIEDGVVVKTSDNWLVEETRLHEISVPATLTRILQARLDALYPEVESVLKWASVIGRVFWDEAVSCIATSTGKPLSSNEIAAALSALRNKEMVFYRSPSAFARCNEFIFKHAMLREVAYERILKRQRSSFHAVAAGWLIQQNSERLSEFGGLIAEHYELAGQPEQALLYLRQAGERAAANFANREAARYFTRALSLLHPEDTRTRFELLAAQERVFDLQGAREAQAKDLETMEVLTEELSDDALRSESALRKANFARRIGDYAKASSAARDALAFAESCADISRQAESRLQLGAVLMLTGDYPAAESEFEQALALVRNAKNALSLDVEHSADLTGKLVHIEASSLRGLGLVAYRREEYEPARTYQLQSLALCREINDRRGEGLTLTNLGNAHAAVSDFSAARTCHEQALCVTREIGDRQAESKVLNNVGSVCIAQGDYPSARKYLERSLSIKREVGDRPGESTTLANLGAVARDQGDLEEALSFFQRAIDIRRAYHDRGGETMAMAGLASVLQALGDYGQAKRYGDEAVRIAVELHDKEDECYIKAQLGLLYHEIGDNDKAQALATQTIAAARSIGTREGEAAGLMCLGHAFAEHQQWEESTRAYQEALAIRRALGQHYLVTDALAGLARVSLQSGAPAEALGHVEQILSFLETGTLIGVSQSFRVRLTCYEVLHANNDQRAHLVLRTAYNLLLDRAERINDPELKRSFLETVPYNREIIDTYRRVATKA